MEYEELQQILCKRFPQLASKFLQCFDIFGEDCLDPYILSYEVWNPYVLDLLRSEDDTQALQEVFVFYEELAISDDEEVRNFLQVALLEALWDEKVVLEKAYTYMFSETRKANEAIREYFLYPKE